MQEVAFKNDFSDAFFDKENALFSIIWLPSTYEMENEDFQSTLMDAAQFVEQHKVKYWMGYTKDFAFIIPPDLQEWTAQDFNQRVLKAGLRKIALIVPSDIIANVGVQQSVEEMEKHQPPETIVTRYFDDDQQAKAWLLDE